MMRRVLPLFLSIIACAARADDPLAISGATERPIPESATTVTIDFPLKVDASVTQPPRIDVVSVSLDGKQWPADGFTARVEILKAGAGLLRLTVDPAKVNEPGKYGLTLMSSPAEANPPAGAISLLIPVTLTRAAGELRMTSPLRVNRTIYLPWVWDCAKPHTASISEISRHAAVKPYGKEWRADLSNGNTPAGHLTVTVSDRLDAGRQYAASLSAAGVDGLGAATGTLSIRAPQLSTGVFEQAVEVTSRVSLFWLFVTLLAGIAAGYAVRVRAEQKRLRAEALLDASPQRKAVQDLIARTAESDDSRLLFAALRPLEQKMADESATPEQIRAAAAQAKGAADKIVTDATTRMEQTKAKLAELKTTAGSPDQYADKVMELVAAITERLRNVENQLGDGQVRAAKKELEDIENDLARELPNALTQWRVDVRDALGRLGSWPDIATHQPSVDDAQAALKALNPTSDARTSLKAAAELTRHLRHDLFASGVRNIARLARKIADELQSTSEKTHTDAGALAALRDAATKLEAGAGDIAVAGEVESLRKLLGDTLSSAYTAVTQKTDVASLGEGQFLAVLKEMKKVVTEQKLKVVPGQHVPEPSVEFTADKADMPPPPAPEHPLRIAVSGDAVAGEVLQFRVAPVDDASMPKIRSITWTIDGTTATGTDATLVYTTTAAKSLSVRADVRFDDGSRAAATLTLEVLSPPIVPSVQELTRTRRSAENVQTTVAGLLIVLTGILIFKTSFVGTLDDFVAALLWGFGTDLGLARVREVSKPLLERTVKFPGT